ncbi:MAG: tetratricopeptide repeat protein [bacterium]|nr:tetratricopeptide repeat protein [bacterium]
MREVPDGHPAYDVMAAAARVGGDREGARELLEAVLERRPEHRSAREALAEL